MYIDVNQHKKIDEMVRNECFRVAMDYLFKNGLIADQSELSKLTGISETSISRILNNRVKEPSESTIRKLNEAFGNIFNPEYFRGHSIHLLMEDVAYYAKHPEEDASSNRFVPIDDRKKPEPANDTPPIPTWADTLISIMSEQIKQNEALTRELRKSIADVNTLRDDLRRLIRGQYLPNINAGTYLAASDMEPQK